MKRRKTSKLLIRHSEGSSLNCYECGRGDVKYIVHYDYEDPELDIDDEEKRMKIESRFKYMVVERFLCHPCWLSNWYNNPEKYDDDGAGEFTSIYKKDREKKIWKTCTDYE